MLIKIKRIKNGKLPEYKTDGSAGADCYARINGKLVLKPGERTTVPLGFAIELPIGYEMEIRGRSGLASKNGIEVFQGTIDSDYRGEVGAIIRNTDDKDFEIKPFDRIAQAVISPVIKAEWHLTENLSETERGEGGFGSTGVSEVKVNYPHEVEKFYEPFSNEHKLEEFLGKEVIIDKFYKGRLTRIVRSGLSLKFYFQVTGSIEKVDLGNIFMHDIEMDPLMAFQRVTIDGHRFGEEMEFEG